MASPSSNDKPTGESYRKLEKVEFVQLPEDDPRAISAAERYPPIPIPGLPNHPHNLFFKIDGVITEPVLSLAHLRALASRPIISPSNSDKESDTEGEDLDKPLDKVEKHFSCQICGKELVYQRNMKRHMEKVHKLSEVGTGKSEKSK